MLILNKPITWLFFFPAILFSAILSYGGIHSFNDFVKCLKTTLIILAFFEITFQALNFILQIIINISDTILKKGDSLLDGLLKSM